MYFTGIKLRPEPVRYRSAHVLDAVNSALGRSYQFRISTDRLAPLAPAQEPWVGITHVPSPFRRSNGGAKA